MDSKYFTEEPHSPGNDTNITDVQTEQHGLPPISTYILMILFPTCACIVVIGNGLVLFGLARFKILRHPSNIFVGVLSGVDMTLSISFVMLTIQVKNPTLFDGQLFYCQFRVIILSTNLLSSQLLLLGMYYTLYKHSGSMMNTICETFEHKIGTDNHCAVTQQWYCIVRQASRRTVNHLRQSNK